MISNGSKRSRSPAASTPSSSAAQVWSLTNCSPLRIYGPLTKQLGDLWLSIFTLMSVQYGAVSEKYRKPLKMPVIDRGRRDEALYK